MIKRKKTRTVSVGGVNVGSDHPVSIQSMTKTDTADIDSTVRQIHELEKAGCEIIRLAVKNEEAAKALGGIKKQVTIPVVADIHFSHKLALEAILQGVDKIRINPGNITDKAQIKEIALASKDKGIPVRIGVNSGSIPENIRNSSDIASGMVELALQSIDDLRNNGMDDIVASLKASDIITTVDAYRKMSDRSDVPLHLGITAAGIPSTGIIRSSIGIGALLLDGIGDTIRVSLTGDPVEEVRTAKELLASLGLRNFGPEILACPTCGRCQVDVVRHSERSREKNLKIQT